MKNHTRAYLSLIFICIVWGTTYLVIKIAVDHYPPILFAAIRQVISAAIIGVIGLIMSRSVDLSWQNIKQQMLIGFLLITVGNGCVSWGEQTVPSGVAALICSMMPICTVIINLAMKGAEKINSRIIIGMLLGFLGVGFMFKDDLAGNSNDSYLVGAVVTFMATFSWALGSVLSKKNTSKVNPVFNSGLQLFFGGLFLFIGSPLVDDYSNLNFFQPEVLWSMAYLVVFGSVLAYTAYMYALKELPVGIVTLYAYVNPLVAVILGYYLLNEQLNLFTGLAFASIAIGVYLVNQGYRRQVVVVEKPSGVLVEELSEQR